MSHNACEQDHSNPNDLPATSISHPIPQVIILLYISMWLVHWLWRIGDDPDNCAIPYMTAIGDLLGTGLLAAAFQILWLVGDRDADVGE